jgi:hypothetical protein
MYGMNRNDDFLGEDENVDTGNGETIAFPGNQNNKDYIERELLRIIAVYKRTNNPELLGNMIDDLKKKIKGGNVLEILKDPIIYGGLSVVLLAIILYKISGKRKK